MEGKLFLLSWGWFSCFEVRATNSVSSTAGGVKLPSRREHWPAPELKSWTVDDIVSNKMDFSHLREINSGLSLCPIYPQSQSTSSDWQPRPPPSNFTTQNLKLFPPPAVLIGYFILWCHIVTFNILGLWIVSRLLSSCMLQENFMLQWAEG